MSSFGSMGKDNEPFALIMGIIGLLSGAVFFLSKYDVIDISHSYDETFLMFFAGFALISGIMHLLTTFGIMGKGY